MLVLYGLLLLELWYGYKLIIIICNLLYKRNVEHFNLMYIPRCRETRRLLEHSRRLYKLEINHLQPPKECPTVSSKLFTTISPKFFNGFSTHKLKIKDTVSQGQYLHLHIVFKVVHCTLSF